MAMALGRSIARFTSSDPRLHNWSVADPRFLPWGGNNGHGTTGVMFFPLPKASAGSAPASDADGSAGLTHMLGGMWSDRHPCAAENTPSFRLGWLASANAFPA